MRREQRPGIRSPLYVQFNDPAEDEAHRQLLNKVITWLNIEAGPSPVGSAAFLSPHLTVDILTDDPFAIISGSALSRVFLAASRIYPRPLLNYAYWAIVREWVVLHFCESFALVPPGVMVIYTPREAHERSIRRTLFGVSYRFSSHKTRSHFDESRTSMVDVSYRGMIRQHFALTDD